MLPIFTAQIITGWLASKGLSAKGFLIASVIAILLVPFGINFMALKKADDHAIALFNYASQLIKQSPDIQECAKRHASGEFHTIEGVYVLCNKPFVMQIFTQAGIKHQRTLDAINDEYLKQSTMLDSGQKYTDADSDKVAKKLFKIIQMDSSEPSRQATESSNTSQTANGGILLLVYLLGLVMITCFVLVWDSGIGWKWLMLPVFAGFVVINDASSHTSVLLPGLPMLLPFVVNATAEKARRTKIEWGIGSFVISIITYCVLIKVSFVPSLPELSRSGNYYTGISFVIGCSATAAILAVSVWLQQRPRAKQGPW